MGWDVCVAGSAGGVRGPGGLAGELMAAEKQRQCAGRGDDLNTLGGRAGLEDAFVPALEVLKEKSDAE